MKKNRNVTFSLMYFIGIIMVIDCHTGGGIGLLSNLFPYDSFFMPMFFFCSGYFFTRKPILIAIKHKVKKLLLPYIIWNFFFCGLAFILDKCIATFWFSPITLKSFILSLIGNPLTSINGPAWFVITLFWIQIGYIFIDKILDNRVLFKDLIITVLCILGGFISVYLSFNNFVFEHYFVRYIYRLLFYFQFYNLGYIFKKYLYKFFDNNKLKLFLLISCMFINVILISIFGISKIVFPATSEMGCFSSIYLPLITSITGIFFYYIICEYIGKIVGENKFIEFVSQNTFEIMQLHLLYANIPNIIIYIIRGYNSNLFFDFNDAMFVSTAWLQFYLSNSLIYFFNSLVLSLVTIYSLKYIKKVKGV